MQDDTNANVDFSFEWTSDMSVGDEQLDMQHRRLLGAVNDLLAAVLYGKGDEQVHTTLRFLDGYIYDHLADEERYMQAHNFPQAAEHTAMHAAFIEKYKELSERLKQDGPTHALALDIQTYIGHWWMHHIGVEDKRYADYIAARE